MLKRLLSFFIHPAQLSNSDLQEAHILGKLASDSISGVFELAGCNANTFPLERGQRIGGYVIGYCDVMSQCFGNDSKSDLGVESCREAYRQLFGVERGGELLQLMEVAPTGHLCTLGVEAGRADAINGFAKKAPSFGLMNLLMDEYEAVCTSPENLHGFEEKWNSLNPDLPV
jgi:hypothetical protein